MPLKKICESIPQRWVIVLTCFFGYFNMCKIQICLSVAITQMVVWKNQTIDINNDTCTETIDYVSFGHGHADISKGMKFDWDERDQGKILSSYFWGYIITCTLGGMILDKLGAKRTMAVSILLNSFFTLLLPQFTIWYGKNLLIALRFLTGIGGGMMAPAMIKLFSRWIPEEERSSAAAWGYAGGTFGYLVGQAASGAIIERSDTGWPVVFYVYGLVGIVFFCIQCAICYESPDEHPWISESEVELLKTKLKHTHVNVPPTPWNLIIRSRPIWATLIAITGNLWCSITIISDTPKFISSVLRFNVETNGLISSIPQMTTWVFNCGLSWICDWLIVKKIVSIACVRKIGNSIAALGTGPLLIIATYVGCNRIVIVILYVIAITLFSGINFSTMVNVLDLTPNYAGEIQGILCGIAISVGLISPYAAGNLTPNQTVDEWRRVFWLMFGISGCTNIVFLIFGKGEVQEWNDPKFLRHGKQQGGDDNDNNITLVSEKDLKDDDKDTF